MFKYIINIITLANDLLSTCFTEWTLLRIIIYIVQIQLCNNSSGISSTCHHYERCEITELVLHKFQVLVEFNCLMLLSITTLGHDLFCEFVCFYVVSIVFRGMILLHVYIMWKAYSWRKLYFVLQLAIVRRQVCKI